MKRFNVHSPSKLIGNDNLFVAYLPYPNGRIKPILIVMKKFTTYFKKNDASATPFS